MVEPLITPFRIFAKFENFSITQNRFKKQLFVKTLVGQVEDLVPQKPQKNFQPIIMVEPLITQV